MAGCYKINTKPIKELCKHNVEFLIIKPDGS